MLLFFSHTKTRGKNLLNRYSVQNFAPLHLELSGREFFDFSGKSQETIALLGRKARAYFAKATKAKQPSPRAEPQNPTFLTAS
jgi:hypothetical protein